MFDDTCVHLANVFERCAYSTRSGGSRFGRVERRSASLDPDPRSETARKGESKEYVLQVLVLFIVDGDIDLSKERDAVGGDTRDPQGEFRG
ncbi:hypothetical protein D3C76_1241740 [compost metagenome]